ALPGGVVGAAVLRGGAAFRGVAQSAQDALAGAHAGRVAGCRRGALVEAVAEFVNGPQSQFGRRDSYPVPRLEHLKTMTRFPFRMTTASALVLVVMTGAPGALGKVWGE